MLQAEALACERGGVALFSGLGFSLGAGELLRVRGANGSGKTSLLRILAGLTRPAAGSVRWRGAPLAALGEDYHRSALFVGHASAVKDELTVRENVAFSLRLSGLDASAGAVGAALERLGLARLAEVPARYLSQGQRRRAALARLAAASTLPLWILDEPFAALDAAAVDTVCELATAHLAGGGLLVLTSHQDAALDAAASCTMELG